MKNLRMLRSHFKFPGASKEISAIRSRGHGAEMIRGEKHCSSTGPGLSPSTHWAAHNHLSLQSREVNALFWPQQALHTGGTPRYIGKTLICMKGLCQ